MKIFLYQLLIAGLAALVDFGTFQLVNAKVLTQYQGVGVVVAFTVFLSILSYIVGSMSVPQRRYY